MGGYACMGDGRVAWLSLRSRIMGEGSQYEWLYAFGLVTLSNQCCYVVSLVTNRVSE